MIFRRSKIFFFIKKDTYPKRLSIGERGFSLSQLWSWFQTGDLFSGHQVISNLTLVITVVLKREKIKITYCVWSDHSPTSFNQFGLDLSLFLIK